MGAMIDSVPLLSNGNRRLSQFTNYFCVDASTFEAPSLADCMESMCLECFHNIFNSLSHSF